MVNGSDLVEPPATVPKAPGSGDTIRKYVVLTPSPVRLSVTVSLTVSTMVLVSLYGPGLGGANVTVIEQLAPAPSDAGHVFDCEKGAATPWTPSAVVAPVPMFLMANACIAVPVPATVAGNPYEFGVIWSCGTGITPVAVRGSVVESPAPSATSRVVVSVVEVVGEKVTWNVQVAFWASVTPAHVSDADTTAKSPADPPLNEGTAMAPEVVWPEFFNVKRTGGEV